MKAPIGYTYKYLKIDKNLLQNNNNDIQILKDEDIENHNKPIIRDGFFKGYIGMGGYVLCKIKL